MNVSSRDVDLSILFPFRSCSYEFLMKAKGLGRCVRYNSGEPVLLNGSPAKHCGVIVDGQAVAFKIDENKKRYQLCLDEGCFIGLETLQENNCYNGKIAALTDLEVFFWNADGVAELMRESPDFSAALTMLCEGKSYQEQWLIPESDVTDPVLCSRPAHWLSAAVPVMGILAVFFLCLWVCSLMVRRYPVAWLLIFALIIGAGSLLYRQISRWREERLIITTKNFILFSGSAGAGMMVRKLHTIQSLKIIQNFAQKLFRIGKIDLLTEDGLFSSPVISEPELTAVLIRYFAEQASLGRPVLLLSGGRRKKKSRDVSEVKKSVPTAASSMNFDVNAPAKKVQENNAGTGTAVPVVPKFKTIEFHAHWALLVKMLIKPLIVLAVILFLTRVLKNSPYLVDIQKVLFLAAAMAAAVCVYQFFSWRNHRFYIEEDRIRDYSKKPLTGEDQNVAMNNKIHSVRFVKKGFFQVLLNYGTVYILAGEGELSFDYVGDPQSVQQQIMDNCARFEAQRIVDAETRQREYINGLISGIRNETDRDPSADNFLN
ncbi:MAG: cyclic nucleotide-binding domain-containing protein [Anaerolineaceae bacterium]|nr:cyclic nucleotide-binding domain-containing protein [Anaerolineaceae bacterium]